QLKLDNQAIGTLEPDPHNPNFQLLNLGLKEIPNLGSRLELIPTYFEPGGGDTRLLGVMVKSIEVDRSDAWFWMQKRIWLALVWVGLMLISLSLNWFYRQRHLAWAGYGTSAAALAGSAASLLLLALLFRLGQLGWFYIPWTLSLLYLSAVGIALGLRKWPKPE